MNNQYTFKVPSIGTIRVNAKSFHEALMATADAAGITMVSAVENRRRPLRLVGKHHHHLAKRVG